MSPGRDRDDLHRPRSALGDPFVESFNCRVRDELLNVEDFANLAEAKVVVKDWRVEYSTFHPHSALGGFTPAGFAKRWTDQHQPVLLQ